jgi:uncharacterized protein
MSEPQKTLPVPSADSIPFWQACREHELRLQKCDSCGHLLFPPASRCPQCLGNKLTWARLSGRGRIYSFVVYHRVYHPGFEKSIPYVVALVELEEGPRLISNIVGCDPKAVRCDMAVSVVFDDVADEIALHQFRLVTTDQGDPYESLRLE